MKKVQILVLAAVPAVIALLSGTSWAHRRAVDEIREGSKRTIYIEEMSREEIRLVAAQASKEKRSLPVEEIAIIQELFPGNFYPSKVTVKKGLPVKIYITSTEDEHINRVSIQPFVSSSDLLEAGKVTIIEFTPDRIGEFKIRNIGHGFEGTITVEE